jgi:hypothetical protein
MSLVMLWLLRRSYYMRCLFRSKYASVLGIERAFLNQWRSNFSRRSLHKCGLMSPRRDAIDGCDLTLLDY